MLILDYYDLYGNILEIKKREVIFFQCGLAYSSVGSALEWFYRRTTRKLNAELRRTDTQNNMNQETKVLIGITLVTVAIVLAGILFLNKSNPVDFSNAKKADQKILVRPDNHRKGPKDAKVTVVEFGDFQCPACGAAQPTVRQLEREYKDTVAFIFRHYPLPQHQNAFIAAQAAEAAGEQGKFWEMHDKLYDTQNAWSNSKGALDIFAGYAKDLKLNVDQFRKAVTTNKFKNKIMADEQDGGTIGINSTPTFYINGYEFPGAIPYDQFKSAIDTLLAK